MKQRCGTVQKQWGPAGYPPRFSVNTPKLKH